MTKIFSYSQCLLALAIAFLAFSLVKIANEIPNILLTIDKVSPQVEAISNEVSLVRGEVALVRQLIAKQTPEILTQVSEIIPVVNQVVEESQQYSKQIPTLLAHIDKLEQHISQLEKMLPSILQQIDTIIATTDKTTAEISLWRPISSNYLTEIELSRQNIPQYLTRVEGIADDAKSVVYDAKNVGKEATSGLVSGFFKGVISLPFEVVSGLTGIIDSSSRSAKYLTADDVALMQEHSVSLLENELKNQVFWHNLQTGNRGSISKNKASSNSNKACYNLVFINQFKKKKKNENETINKLMCRNDKELWQVIE